MHAHTLSRWSVAGFALALAAVWAPASAQAPARVTVKTEFAAPRFRLTFRGRTEPIQDSVTTRLVALLGDDARWLLCRRPVVITGGELTLADLEPHYSLAGKFYIAPLQVKANNGLFVADDFGRQIIRPDELLNRWMLPMERGIDHLTLQTGETFEVPFDVLLVFATNLSPSRLGDEAFFRRIQHKVRIPDPDEAAFRTILRGVAGKVGIPDSDAAASYLIDAYYRAPERPFRGVHPRDIFNLIRDIGRFQRRSPEFSEDWIDLACSSYFVQD